MKAKSNKSANAKPAQPRLMSPQQVKKQNAQQQKNVGYGSNILNKVR